ncbi:hypothetical protein BC826DRAFT_1007008 [Russula brevipes]|nr:hypothetical protein BC826DRAFT_1007008 [Russula brevipes]
MDYLSPAFHRQCLTSTPTEASLTKWKGKWKVFGGASDSNAIMSAPRSDGASYIKNQRPFVLVRHV